MELMLVLLGLFAPAYGVGSFLIGYWLGKRHHHA